MLKAKYIWKVLFWMIKLKFPIIYIVSVCQHFHDGKTKEEGWVKG